MQLGMPYVAPGFVGCNNDQINGSITSIHGYSGIVSGIPVLTLCVKGHLDTT